MYLEVLLIGSEVTAIWWYGASILTEALDYSEGCIMVYTYTLKPKNSTEI